MNPGMTRKNEEAAPEYLVAAFYKFIPLPEFAEMREPLRSLCDAGGVRGTILLAPEGVNGTVAGPRAGVEAALAHLRSFGALADLEHKESFTATIPFARMKVRLKREIMGLGDPGAGQIREVGVYVPAEEWNDLISDPSVLLIDTRNDYEVAVGTFEGAVDPKTQTFRDFPEFVRANLDPERHTKIAMYCTGGIRCEKASAYMIDQGFPEVYHLQGGILKYLETVAPEESRWRGECFVFDERVSVDHTLQPGDLIRCFGCGGAITAEDKLSEKYEEGISCPVCHDGLTEQKRRRATERQRQIELARKRKV